MSKIEVGIADAYYEVMEEMNERRNKRNVYVIIMKIGSLLNVSGIYSTLRKAKEKADWLMKKGGIKCEVHKITLNEIY